MDLAAHADGRAKRVQRRLTARFRKAAATAGWISWDWSCRAEATSPGERRPVLSSAGTDAVRSGVSASEPRLARRSPRTAAGLAPQTSATQITTDAKRFAKRTKACRDL